MAVVSNSGYVVLCFALSLIAFPGLAQAMVTTSINDTWINSVNTSAVYGSSNTINISTNAGSIYQNTAFFKFNSSLPLMYIIENLSVNFYTVNSGCTSDGCIHAIYILPNNSWDDTMNFTNSPPLDETDRVLMTEIKEGNVSGKWQASDDIFDTSLSQMTAGYPINKTIYNVTRAIKYFYNSSVISIYSNSTWYSPGGHDTGKNTSIGSMEGIYAPFLNFTLSNYKSGYVTGMGDNWFNFESFYNTNNTADNLIEFQDILISTAGAIYSIYNNGITMREIPGAPGWDEANNTFNETIGRCNDRFLFAVNSQGTNTTAIYNLNQPVVYENGTIKPYYETICLNLSSMHSGYPFYGVIKIINATADNVSYYWAIYTQYFNSFSLLGYSPDPPQYQQPLEVYWSTNAPLSSILYYRYNLTGIGTYSNWYIAANVSTLTNYHNASIPAEEMNAGNFQIYFAGVDGSGNYYNSSIYNFSVGFSQTFPGSNNPNATVPGAIQRASQTGICGDLQGCTWLFGFILLGIGTGLSFFAGGIRLGLGVFSGLGLVLSIPGFIPQFFAVGFIVLTGVVIVTMFRKSFGS